MPSSNREFEPPVHSYRFGEFELDLSEENLLRDGQKLVINRRMFQVLLLLVERSGEIVTKNEFFDKVWEGSFVEDNNLTVTMTALRKALGDDAKHARFIENLPRKGYRFIAPVTSIASPSVTRDGTNSFSKQTRAARFPENRRMGWVGTVAVAVCLLVVLTIAAVSYGRLWNPAASSKVRIDSIAILPFDSRNPDSEYLADGLTDGIINSLSQLPGVRVIGRNSVFQYKNKMIDPTEVSRELNVRSIVTGQVEDVDNTLVITAELTDLNGSSRSWRQQFTRSKGELIAVQQEMVQAITRDLLFDPDEKPPGQKSKRPTQNAEAYDLYLKGRYYWNKRSNVDLIRSVDLFRAAIDKDPTFAKAYIGLADAYALVNLIEVGISFDDRVMLAQGAIQKALEIDDTIGEAYAVTGINKLYHDWDFAGAESLYLRALELNPNDATARHWYAELLSMDGRFDESYRQYDIAQSLDPLSLPIRTDTAIAHYYAHDFDTAIEILNKCKELNLEYDRTYSFLSWTYREKGMFNESVSALETAYALQLKMGQRPKDDYETVMKYAADLRNSATEAGAKGFWQAELRQGPPGSIYRAIANSKLGEIDKAFEFLETAFKEHQTGMVWLKVSPEFDGIRPDPRYQDMLRRAGFRLD